MSRGGGARALRRRRRPKRTAREGRVAEDGPDLPARAEEVDRDGQEDGGRNIHADHEQPRDRCGGRRGRGGGGGAGGLQSKCVLG
eukprot:SAG11_NODE_3901_length_2156_cov_7.851312_2_plen_85_part_00